MPRETLTFMEAMQLKPAPAQKLPQLAEPPAIGAAEVWHAAISGTAPQVGLFDNQRAADSWLRGVEETRPKRVESTPEAPLQPVEAPIAAQPAEVSPPAEIIPVEAPSIQPAKSRRKSAAKPPAVLRSTDAGAVR